MASAALAAPIIKSPDAFRTISEVATELDVPQHVLRFWESRFVQIKPVKRAGGRRFYRPEDVDLLRGIRALLYSDGLTIRGVQKILKERGLRHVAGIGRGGEPQPMAPEPRIIEKIVFVERPAPEAAVMEPQRAPAPAVKKKASHLRAVPRPMSLPFFDEPALAVVAVLEPQASSFADEERAKLTELLDELVGLKERLRNARR